MAYVLIDVSICDDKNHRRRNWFRENALQELVNKKDVFFIYPQCGKYVSELTSSPKGKLKLLDFLTNMTKQKRTKILDRDVCESKMQEIECLNSWQRNKCCDDEHIFAASALVSNVFVFTADKRMFECLKHLRKDRSLSFCTNFTIIKTQEEYNATKTYLISS